MCSELNLWKIIPISFALRAEIERRVHAYSALERLIRPQRAHFPLRRDRASGLVISSRMVADVMVVVAGRGRCRIADFYSVTYAFWWARQRCSIPRRVITLPEVAGSPKMNGLAALRPLARAAFPFETDRYPGARAGMGTTSAVLRPSRLAAIRSLTRSLSVRTGSSALLT